MNKTLLSFVLPLSLFAFHDYDEPKDTHTHTEKSTLNQYLDSGEPILNNIYRSVNGVAKTLDEFLTGEKDDRTYTESYIRLETSIAKTESQNVDGTIDLKIRLRLPKLKEKYRLVIDNEDNKLDDEFNDHNETLPYQDDKYNVGLEYKTKKSFFDFSTKLGVKLSTRPYIYLKVGANKKVELNESNDIDFAQQFKYSDRFELDSSSSIRYSHYFDKTFTFSNFNQYFINSQEKDNNTYNSLRINQKLTNLNYINYVTSVSSNDNDSNFQIKDYDTYVQYRHFIRKWMYIDVIPSVNWAREHDFDENYTFKLNLGIVISK